MRRRTTFTAIMLLAFTASAADFRPYANGRFGYAVELPADFKTVLTPENGDGVGLESVDGLAKLSVWGNYLTEGGFSQESDLRRKFEADEGWKFAYEKRGASWASFSGTKGDRIIYMRQIALCDHAVGNFTLEYPATQQKRYGPVVDRMAKTLKAPEHCE
ncbi:hypothetical protein GUK36_29720 [Rhizobium leguminosarum]|uniref:Uncharacterized protein n=1 Tax=Rhizobium leguminosarum TaxID=384 RepID=A0A6P0DKK9_RHILE|nr:hypothetical protein [Rhizobium leguminosarum]MDH6273766.1 hypothetical protein [Rhizobium leguminosarum]NEK53588.1 hypothetical protein [Rhizobium leguminosarum]